MQLPCDRIESLEVALEPGAQEPCHAVVLSYGRHQGVSLQDSDMVLHQIILHAQVGGELVEVPGALPESSYYSSSVLAATGAAE